MGYKDFDRLQPIYAYLKSLESNKLIKTNFKMDAGFRETGLMISEYGDLIFNKQYQYFTPDEYRQMQKKGWREFVPDFLSTEPRLFIIEYQEEGKPRRGHKIVKKGHDEFSKRDVDKKTYYQLINALYLEIWETQPWKKQLHEFLLKNHLFINK